MKSRLLVSLLAGGVLAGGPALVIFLTRRSAAAWTEWLALAWVPGALISKWILRLRPHDAPYVDCSIILSGAVYAVACVLLLKRYWK